MTKLEKQVLAYVNRLRERYDIGPPLADLPKGQKFETESCPIARALHADVDQCAASWWEGVLGNGSVREFHPQYVTDFINKFDAGKIPRLVA